MALGSNIRRIRTHRGWTLADLSDLSGVDVGTIHALEQRDSTRSKFAQQIAKGLGVTLDQLHSSEPPLHEITIRPHDASAEENPALYRINLKREAALSTEEQPIHVPLLANAGSMGTGNELLHDDVLLGSLPLQPRWVSEHLKPTSPMNLRFLHAYGDSMSPTFSSGDILLVDTGQIDPGAIDGVYAMSANDRLYIKRVRQTLGGKLEVSSDNSQIKTVDELNGDHSVTVHGRVIWVWNGKRL